MGRRCAPKIARHRSMESASRPIRSKADSCPLGKGSAQAGMRRSGGPTASSSALRQIAPTYATTTSADLEQSRPISSSPRPISVGGSQGRWPGEGEISPNLAGGAETSLSGGAHGASALRESSTASRKLFGG